MNKLFYESEFKNGNRIDYVFEFIPDGNSVPRGPDVLKYVKMVNGGILHNMNNIDVLHDQFKAIVDPVKRGEPFPTGFGKLKNKTG